MFIVNSEQRIECNDANIAYFYIATIEFSEDNLFENPNVTNKGKLVKNKGTPRKSQVNLRKPLQSKQNLAKPS